jgi:hypothetical protein
MHLCIPLCGYFDLCSYFDAQFYLCSNFSIHNFFLFFFFRFYLFIYLFIYLFYLHSFSLPSFFLFLFLPLIHPVSPHLPSLFARKFATSTLCRHLCFSPPLSRSPPTLAGEPWRPPAPTRELRRPPPPPLRHPLSPSPTLASSPLHLRGIWPAAALAVPRSGRDPATMCDPFLFLPR